MALSFKALKVKGTANGNPFFLNSNSFKDWQLTKLSEYTVFCLTTKSFAFLVPL